MINSNNSSQQKQLAVLPETSALVKLQEGRICSSRKKLFTGKTTLINQNQSECETWTISSKPDLLKAIEGSRI